MNSNADTEAISNSSENAYQSWKTDLMNKPEIERMMEITHFVMLLPDLIKLNVSILEADSNQNWLMKKYLLELIKLNIELLMRYEPSDLLLFALNLNVDSINLDQPLATLTPGVHPNTQHDPPQNLKRIYGLLEEAKAYVEQVEFVQKLIQVQRFIQEKHEQFQDELYQVGSRMHSNNLKHDLIKHIVDLVQVGFHPTTSKSNLYLAQQNLGLMKKIINSINPESLANSRSPRPNELVELIPEIDVMSLDDTDWEKINSDAAMSIQNSSPEQKLYIDTNDSFRFIWDLAGAICKHTHQGGERVDKKYTWCGSFYDAILKDDLVKIEKFLKKYPVALTAKITKDGYTALHVALKERKKRIAMKLLARLKENYKHMKENNKHRILEKQDIQGKTVLYIAALGDFLDIAKELVAMNTETLLIACDDKAYPFPLFVAVKYGNKQMSRYLYEMMRQNIEEETMKSSLEERKGKWASLLGELIYNDDYDLASLIILDYPDLALTTDKSGKEETWTPLFELAQRPLVIKRKFHPDTPSKASELLRKIISKVKDLESQEPTLKAALFKAVEVGNVDFVTKVIDHLPLAVSWLNDQYQNIFHIAIIHRQEKIFNLIYKFDPQKNELSGLSDKSNNNMLHLVAKLASQDKRNKVPGAALQLQRELQWFQAVQKMVPNIYTKNQNLLENKTPEEILADSKHEDLRREGEIWIKNTAQSCSVVATLITTIMFATAFTVPGGNDQTGRPLLLRRTPFIIFIILDAAALCFSCTSALMFLAILTSSCAQEDFLSSLPNLLIRGLLNLFFSMAAMMLSFGVTIYINTYDRYIWLAIGVMVACVIPIFKFGRTLFPLFNELLRTNFLPPLEKQKEGKLGSSMSSMIV